MFLPDLLAGRHILITGGGTGLGKSMGRRFLELGAALSICGRRGEVLEATAAEHREATGGTVRTAVCDVRDADQVEAMLDRLEAEAPVDTLGNNAAGNFVAKSETLSPRAVRAVVGIVLDGSLHCTLGLGRRWLAGGWGGTVLSIVTSYAWTGSAYVLPSAVAKAGVLAMTRSLAVEWGGRGVRLNAIAPGPFPTQGAWERRSWSETPGTGGHRRLERIARPSTDPAPRSAVEVALTPTGGDRCRVPTPPTCASGRSRPTRPARAASPRSRGPTGSASARSRAGSSSPARRGAAPP